MTDQECGQFLQWALPRLGMRWPGFRKVRRQVHKRLNRRLDELGLTQILEYCGYLKTHPDEWQILESFLRISISRFYRDRGVWDRLRDEVLPPASGIWSRSLPQTVDMRSRGSYTSQWIGRGFEGAQTREGKAMFGKKWIVGLAAVVLAVSTAAQLWGAVYRAIDLGPSGFYDSMAFGVDGAVQVGYGDTLPIGGAHALMWSGTADSYVDLNPSGFDWSIANSVSGAQQVGRGEGAATGGTWHALLWSGNAASYVDLNPSGYERSMAFGTNGTQQVGEATYTEEGTIHALLWSGTAASAVDLHELLPSGFVSSTARAIDDQGNIVGIAHTNTGGARAILWTAVPEPPTFVTLGGLLGMGLIGGWWRRLRRR
jgi:hypothetical protein